MFESVSTGILRVGQGAAHLAAIGAILLSAYHFLETVAWWAAVLALVLWPITFFVGPVVTALNGEWIVPALFALSLVAFPLSFVLGVLDGTLREGNWRRALSLTPTVILLALALPGGVVHYQLDKRLRSWPPWSVLERRRAERAAAKVGFSLEPAKLLVDVSGFAAHGALLTIIGWSAFLASRQGEVWAVLATVVVWPITMFVAPALSAAQGDWALAALLATALLARPFAAALLYRIPPDPNPDSAEGPDVG